MGKRSYPFRFEDPKKVSIRVAVETIDGQPSGGLNYQIHGTSVGCCGASWGPRARPGVYLSLKHVEYCLLVHLIRTFKESSKDRPWIAKKVSNAIRAMRDRVTLLKKENNFNAQQTQPKEPKPMEITQIVVTPKAIRWNQRKQLGKNESSIESHESKDRPLPSFYKAWDKVRKILGHVMEVDSGWAIVCVLLSVQIRYTKAGTRSATLVFEREMAITKNDHKMNSPCFQFDKPAPGETQKQECTKAQASALAAMIMEIENYAKGKRAQGLLNLDDDKKQEEDPDLKLE